MKQILGPMSGKTPTSEAEPTVSPESGTQEPVVITIGNHTDMSGVASSAMVVITKALEDITAYYNEENLIPGVTFEIITFDGGYNPEMDKPGYDQLKEQGADLFWGCVAKTPVTLKPYLEEDRMTFFTAAPATEAFVPPGWVFACGQTLVQWEAATLLKWIAENDPDYPKDRPAIVGGAFWDESYGVDCLAGAEEYVKAHPEQYEWAGGYISNWSFVWTEEVEGLKDCDYVFPPIPPNNFVRQYREAGHSAKLIGTDAHVAFLEQLDDAGLWEEFDGLLFIKPSQWWNDEGEIIALTNELLQIYRPHEAEEIKRTGTGYMAIQQLYVMFELIKAAAEIVGPEKLNSQAIYDASQSFSLTVDGCPHSFSQSKRTSVDALAVYELRGAEKDCFRVDPRWLPVIYEP